MPKNLKVFNIKGNSAANQTLSRKPSGMEEFSIPFKLAYDYINRTNRTVFLTGKAGTGKTTFLREVKKHSAKQTAVVAPTGVAAINAGGSTIHSFFQLPFPAFLPEKCDSDPVHFVAGKNDLLSRVKMTANRRNVLEELELLIIDEISMVRCDTVDAIDTILRHIRHRPNEAFGGVQLLLIGDMFQLAPVAKSEEWLELSRFYQSPYFFHSRIMMQQPPVYIELDKIYRQKNDDFIRVLNEVRHNNLSARSREMLQQRFDPDFVPEDGSNYITLCSHNYLADEINRRELMAIKAETIIYHPEIAGDYPEKNYPLDKPLELKLGAKVMFIKNDPDKEKRFYNGKIGYVTTLDDEYIKVQCAGEPDEISLSIHTWENIKYEINAETLLLNENVIGTFSQFPLRLAWAITIHKSQGLTFENAIIDAGKAFSAGQVYVALSRCTSLEGLVLKSRINADAFFNHRSIVAHSSGVPEMAEVEQRLKKDEQEFQRQLLCQLFDFSGFLTLADSLQNQLEKSPDSFNDRTNVFLSDIRRRFEELQNIGKKFQQQLSANFNGADLINSRQERITAGAIYFKEKISDLLTIIVACDAETDSKSMAENFNDQLKALFKMLVLKEHLLSGAEINFSVDAYYQCRRSFNSPPFSVNIYSGKRALPTHQSGVDHPVLFARLKELRNEICESRDLPVFMVASSATLLELVQFLPLNTHDISKISGFGKAKSALYGQRFLNIITEYCQEHDLESRIGEKKLKASPKGKEAKPGKPDTKLTSYEYFRSGKAPFEIARIRSLTIATIQGHLAHYVIQGEMKLSEMIENEKIQRIEAVLANNIGESLTELKQQLGETITFTEIRIVDMVFKARKKIAGTEVG